MNAVLGIFLKMQCSRLLHSLASSDHKKALHQCGTLSNECQPRSAAVRSACFCCLWVCLAVSAHLQDAHLQGLSTSARRLSTFVTLEICSMVSWVATTRKKLYNLNKLRRLSGLSRILVDFAALLRVPFLLCVTLFARVIAILIASGSMRSGTYHFLQSTVKLGCANLIANLPFMSFASCLKQHCFRSRGHHHSFAWVS